MLVMCFLQLSCLQNSIPVICVMFISAIPRYEMCSLYWFARNGTFSLLDKTW